MRFIYTKTFARFFVIFVSIGLFIVFDTLGFLDPVKGGFLKVYGAGSQLVWQAGNKTKQIWKVVFAIKNLASENAQLTQQINELSFENAHLQSAQQENILLRRALNYQQETKFNLISAEVRTFDPTGFDQIATINKGSSTGIKVGQAAIVSPGLLVGKVSKVYAGNSEVTLITDPAVTMNAEIAESGAKGLVLGRHGLSLLFDLLTQNELVKAGDAVVTSGLGDDFPRGLLIGNVIALKSAASELFQKAYVMPAADLRNLQFLFIIQ